MLCTGEALPKVDFMWYLMRQVGLTGVQHQLSLRLWQRPRIMSMGRAVPLCSGVTHSGRVLHLQGDCKSVLEALVTAFAMSTREMTRPTRWFVTQGVRWSTGSNVGGTFAILE